MNIPLLRYEEENFVRKMETKKEKVRNYWLLRFAVRSYMYHKSENVQFQLETVPDSVSVCALYMVLITFLLVTESIAPLPYNQLNS